MTVIYPNRFLEGEDVANNFLFNADRLVVDVASMCMRKLFANIALGFYRCLFTINFI